MKKNDYKNLQIKAHEAFIRRASQINLPFMLKGSYITRQYFQNPDDRTPADLDWVYMETLTDELTARQKLNEWATLVTEFEIDDNVKYTSFKENEFWRRIDYAMADDFPTVNTDLECLVDGERVGFGLDVSFNLDIEQPPVPLMYQPLEGEPFLIPNTVPISLQISWKIHQTLVRPRFKDLFDLMHLVRHPTFDENIMDQVLQALVNECSADNIDLVRLKYFLNYEIEKLFSRNSIHEVWAVWRHNEEIKTYNIHVTYERGHFSTDVSKLPGDLKEFLKMFRSDLESAGFNRQLFDKLPKPTRGKRNNFDGKTSSNNIENDKNKRWSFTNFLKKLSK